MKLKMLVLVTFTGEAKYFNRNETIVGWIKFMLKKIDIFSCRWNVSLRERTFAENVITITDFILRQKYETMDPQPNRRY